MNIKTTANDLVFFLEQDRLFLFPRKHKTVPVFLTHDETIKSEHTRAIIIIDAF